MGTGDIMLGITLQWTSIPSRIVERSINIPSCFIVQQTGLKCDLKQDGLGFKGESNGAADLDKEEIEPQQPTKIQLMLPSVDNSVHEESSAHVSVDQYTCGDVSSISGGNF